MILKYLFAKEEDEIISEEENKQLHICLLNVLVIKKYLFAKEEDEIISEENISICVFLPPPPHHHRSSSPPPPSKLIRHINFSGLKFRWKQRQTITQIKKKTMSLQIQVDNEVRKAT